MSPIKHFPGSRQKGTLTETEFYITIASIILFLRYLVVSKIWLIDFYGMSTCLGLFYALGLRNHLHLTFIFGGDCGVVVIVVGNGHGDTSSNPRRDWLHFT